jgi:Ser/Thr protein kinase RdoA (MazF antagonist)
VIEVAKSGSPAVRQEAIRLEAVLNSIPRDASMYGLLHNDLELDNLIWNDGIATVLDFDEYSDGWYLHDIAKALDDVLVDGETIDDDRGREFLAGYRSERALDESLLARLPDFAALTRLHTWALIDRSLDLAVEDVDRDWMVSLIGRFIDMRREYEAGLASGVAALDPIS